MTPEKLKIAKEEARRFLAKVRELEGSGEGPDYWGPSKHKSAVKRASMDLTRALAELRRG